MPIKSIIACLILVPSLMSGAFRTSGRLVSITVQDGGMIAGELLSVRPVEVILSLYAPGAPDSVLEKNPTMIRHIRLADIIRIHVEGESHLGAGMALGSIGGLVCGILATSVSEPDRKDDVFGIYEGMDKSVTVMACMAGGFLFGTIIGSATSVPDADLLNPSLDQVAINQLIGLSRYSENEPSYLKAL